MLIGHKQELAVYVLDPAYYRYKNPLYSALPLCMLRPPPHNAGIALVNIPDQPQSLSKEGGGLFCSDPEAALLVIHFRNWLPDSILLDYVLCIPRAALVARLGLSAASADRPHARAVRVLQWEDWTRGGVLLRFSMDDHMRLQVATFGSRVAVMSHSMQSDGGPLASPDIRVFEVHPWAHASNIHTSAELWRWPGEK